MFQVNARHSMIFENYINRGLETAFSTFLFSLTIFIIFFFKMHFIHILIFILIYIIIFIYTQGKDLINHGTYNCILFLLLNIIFLIYIFGVYFIILGFIGNKKQKYLCYINFITSYISICLLFFKK